MSAGVGPSKLVAKIASDMDKPDGLTIVPADQVREFLGPLPIGRLWGVGRTTRQALALLGVETIGDLAGVSPDILEKRFGQHGRELADLTRGIDGRPVNPDREVKSIGAEETLPEDIVRTDQARRELLWLSTRVSRRMRRHGFVSRTVTVKVKYSDFKQITRSETLSQVTDQAGVIFRTACRLLEKTAVGQKPVRLLGISLSGLGSADTERQISFFEEPENQRRGRGLERAMDRIADKYGDQAIVPATLLQDR